MSSQWSLAMQMLPVAGAIFAGGFQVSRIDTLFTRADAQEIEQREVREVCLDIHKKVSKIETILEERSHKD
jgi:hypothetical protein